MTAFPTATPVTVPFEETEAMALSLLDQPTTRPASGIPLASSAVAVSVVLCPTVTDVEGGFTTTLATGTARTETVALPCRPSTVAMIVVVPGDTPVAMPDAEMVAMDGDPVAQLTVRPVRLSTWPAAPRAIAVSWTGCPTAILAVDGETSTTATGSRATVTLAVPVAPSLVAVIVTLPAEMPVTSPALETLATCALLDE